MPCESCAIQFSVFKRKRACSECDRFYCSGCLRRGGGTMCAPCRLLSTRPLTRQNIANLKVRDLQCFLQRQNVSTRGCVEKEELVSLCVSHVNSASYRRRGGARGAGAFSSLKGITNNINEFINSAFDIRTAPPPQAQPPPQPPPSCGGCFNYNNVQPPPGGAAPQPARPERFTTTPGGQRDIFVPVPAAAPSPAQSPTDGIPVETADCFEIEDLDDAGWEFVMRPADPLPNDSEVLMSSPECSAGGATGPRPEPRPPPAAPPPTERRTPPAVATVPPATVAVPPRAASPACRSSADAASGSPLSARSTSELELRPGAARGDTASLAEDGAGRELDVRLEDIASEAELEALSVRQLKALLVRGCVAYRGCVERGELVALAARLWRARDAADDTCRICMAAPLDCVLLECGHVVACAACARRLPECPLCRAYVVRAVRIFRS